MFNKISLSDDFHPSKTQSSYQFLLLVQLYYTTILVPGTNLNNFQMGAFLGYNENKC